MENNEDSVKDEFQARMEEINESSPDYHDMIIISMRLRDSLRDIGELLALYTDIIGNRLVREDKEIKEMEENVRRKP